MPMSTAMFYKTQEVINSKISDISEKHSPWKSNKPIKLTISPSAPTATSNWGSWIFSTSMNLLQASTVMEKHKATRNTALTRAPSTSARAHPNVFFDHFFGDIWNKSHQKFINSKTTRSEQIIMYRLQFICSTTQFSNIILYTYYS